MEFLANNVGPENLVGFVVIDDAFSEGVMAIQDSFSSRRRSSFEG